MLNASKKTTVTVELTPPFTVADLGRAYNILDRELSSAAQVDIKGNVNGKVSITASDQPTTLKSEIRAATFDRQGPIPPTDLRDAIAAEARKVLG